MARQADKTKVVITVRTFYYNKFACLSARGKERFFLAQQALAPIKKYQTITDPIEHLRLHHGRVWSYFDQERWIAFGRKTSQRKSGWEQYHYFDSDLDAAVRDFTGNDVYFSMNNFFRPIRRNENVRELRALYVDLDFYTIPSLRHHSSEAIVWLLDLDHFKEDIPEPNYIIHSGRGVGCVWLMESVPGTNKALSLWGKVQEYLIERLQYLGADLKCKDAARVFRLAGSVNSKTGQPVVVEYRHDDYYTLRELADEYLPELVQQPKQPKKKREKKVKQSVSNGSPVRRFLTLRNLMWHRFNDLNKLVELRHGQLEGCREMMLFLARYWALQYYANPSDKPDTEAIAEAKASALRDIQELNSQFSAPLSDKEVVNATESAEKMWVRLCRGEEPSGDYMELGYNYSNDTLIKELNITGEEQSQLSTIIGADERRTRNTTYQRLKRRAAGVQPREVYEKGRKEQQAQRVEKLRRAILENPNASNRQLAEIVGMSHTWIGKMRHHVTDSSVEPGVSHCIRGGEGPFWVSRVAHVDTVLSGCLEVACGLSSLFAPVYFCDSS